MPRLAAVSGVIPPILGKEATNRASKPLRFAVCKSIVPYSSFGDKAELLICTATTASKMKYLTDTLNSER